MQGYCIQEGHGHNELESELPSQEFFISNLFNGKSHLSEEDLEEIAESLSIGKPSKTSEVSSSSGGHDDHNHRRRRSVASASAASHALHRRAADPHDHGHQTNGGSGTVSCIGVLPFIRA